MADNYESKEKPPVSDVAESEEMRPATEEAPEAEETEEKEDELTEEELRRIIEEQLERVTVAQMVQQMMMTLASVGYQKMGLPEEVNLKYRDLDQARLAVDSLDALLKAAAGKMADEQLEPFRGTLANLKLNYVSSSAKLKDDKPEAAQAEGKDVGDKPAESKDSDG